MKKLLFLIPFLLIQPLKADTKTTGSLGLLQPTTGQSIDPNDATRRSAGDKLNKNFQIIDSSFTTLLGGQSAVANDTTTLGIAISTTGVQVQNLSNSTTTINNTLAQRTLVIDNGGTPGANVTRLTVTGAGGSYVQVAGTGTLTLTGGGGSGSVGNATNTYIVKVGIPVISTSMPSQNPGSFFQVPLNSTMTVVDMGAFCTQGSTVAGTKFKLVHSSSQYYGAPWNFDDMFFDMITSTIVKNGDRYVSPTMTTGSLVISGDYLWVQTSSMPISGVTPANCGVWFHYWEKNPWSP